MKIFSFHRSLRAQTALEYLLLLSVVAVIVIASFGKGALVTQVHDTASTYYAGIAKAIMGTNPKAIDGGWCPASCPVGAPSMVIYQSCACPAPAFGGKNCSGTGQISCSGSGTVSIWGACGCTQNCSAQCNATQSDQNGNTRPCSMPKIDCPSGQSCYAGTCIAQNWSVCTGCVPGCNIPCTGSQSDQNGNVRACQIAATGSCPNGQKCSAQGQCYKPNWGPCGGCVPNCNASCIGTQSDQFGQKQSCGLVQSVCPASAPVCLASGACCAPSWTSCQIVASCQSTCSTVCPGTQNDGCGNTRDCTIPTAACPAGQYCNGNTGQCYEPKDGDCQCTPTKITATCTNGCSGYKYDQLNANPQPCTKPPVVDSSRVASTCQGTQFTDDCGNPLVGTYPGDNSCALTTCPTATCANSCGFPVQGTYAGDSSCAKTRCTNRTCQDPYSCFTYTGTMVASDANCGDSTCVGSTCTDSCSISHDGTKVASDVNCGDSTCKGSTCTDECNATHDGNQVGQWSGWSQTGSYVNVGGVKWDTWSRSCNGSCACPVTCSPSSFTGSPSVAVSASSNIANFVSGHYGSGYSASANELKLLQSNCPST